MYGPGFASEGLRTSSGSGEDPEDWNGSGERHRNPLVVVEMIEDITYLREFILALVKEAGSFVVGHRCHCSDRERVRGGDAS